MKRLSFSTEFLFEMFTWWAPYFAVKNFSRFRSSVCPCIKKEILKQAFDWKKNPDLLLILMYNYILSILYRLKTGDHSFIISFIVYLIKQLFKSHKAQLNKLHKLSFLCRSKQTNPIFTSTKKTLEPKDINLNANKIKVKKSLV
jgi:hypothetical protein